MKLTGKARRDAIRHAIDDIFASVTHAVWLGEKHGLCVKRLQRTAFVAYDLVSEIERLLR